MLVTYISHTSHVTYEVIIDTWESLGCPSATCIRIDRSIALAADPGSFPDIKMMALFGAGSLVRKFIITENGYIQVILCNLIVCTRRSEDLSLHGRVTYLVLISLAASARGGMHHQWPLGPRPGQEGGTHEDETPGFWCHQSRACNRYG